MAVISLDSPCAVAQVCHRGDPGEEGRLERLGVQRREDATKRIVRRDALRQGQHENLFQGVTPGALHARVRQLAEVGGDRCRHRLGHGTSQCPSLHHVAGLGTSPNWMQSPWI